METLTERRAKFVYDVARLAAQAANAPIIPVPWNEREEEFKDQFRDVIKIQCGPAHSNNPKYLHEDWVNAYKRMGWVYGPQYDRTNKIHPDMVPYNKLGQLEKDKDSVFVILCKIARCFIY